MKENIWGRLGYWVIILTCVFISVLLEVKNREYAYDNTYLRVSAGSWAQQNATLKIICQNLMDTLKKMKRKQKGPFKGVAFMFPYREKNVKCQKHWLFMRGKCGQT